MFKNEKIYDEKNCQELIGDGKSVNVNGERVLLARVAPTAMSASVQATSFAASGIKRIDPSNYSAAIAEQKARKRRVSDFIDFDPFYQNGLPTCWAIGVAQMASVQRRLQGLPHVQLSGCSLAVPISGGHVGGWEGDAINYGMKYGIASVKFWPENNTSRSLNDKSEVTADRKNHMLLEFINVGNDANAWASGLLQGYCGVFAYNWMSHVMMMADFVEVSKGEFCFRPRNSWGKWGANNDLGYSGFALYRMGHGTPSSGYLVRRMTSSVV